MIWVTWRLRRNQAVFAAVGLAVLAVFLAGTGARMAGEYHQALATCGATRSCGGLAGQLFSGEGWMFRLVTGVAMIVPALFGMFWGAPLLGKEMEDGTHKLAWSQGVTRRRWLAVGIGWTLTFAATWGAVMSALVTWWFGPENALTLDRFQPSHFDSQAIVPVAYSLFAASLGIACGALFRRVIPAIATTLGVFIGARVLTDMVLRPHYLAPVTERFPLLRSAGGPPPGAWVMSDNVVYAAGRATAVTGGTVPRACHDMYLTGLARCLTAHGWSRLAVFQPASRYWTFQGIEAAIFVVLAGALIALAVRRALAMDA